MALIKNWIVTGDTHGGFNTLIRLTDIAKNMSKYKIEETGVIILGDSGLNFWLNKSDKKFKKLINDFGYHIYCVRGNHEERPENLGYELKYDSEVSGFVYYDSEFDNIKYFADGNTYQIDKYSILIIGGAYSVDKYHRLLRAGYSPKDAEIADPKKCGWFKDECLTKEEMDNIFKNIKNKSFDFVFTHTCPLDWEPSDLFLSNIDQSSVDKSMERWLNDVKNNIDWKIWCFGHFHADRIERENVEQMFMNYQTLEDIWNRWNN